MKTVHEKLDAGQHTRLLGRGARNLEAFLKAMEAREHFYRATKQDTALARKLYEEVITMDPDYALRMWVSPWTHMADVWFGTSKSLIESLGRATSGAEGHCLG